MTVIRPRGCIELHSYNKDVLAVIRGTNLEFSSGIEFLQSVQSFLPVYFRSHTFTVLKNQMTIVSINLCIGKSIFCCVYFQ